MRWSIPLVILISVLGACGGHGEGGGIFCLRDGEVFEVGDSFPAGDGCNFCSCESDGTRGQVLCSDQNCGDGGIRVDGGFDQCAPSGFCEGGVECNGQCCGPGERCDQGFCTCGGGQGCSQMGTGDTCQSGGPVGGDRCGSICCGVTQPCPL
jgi:hypothetical protein